MVAGLEAAVLLIFAVSLGVASFNSRGSTMSSSPVAEVIIYMLFAAGLGLIARGLWRRSAFARTPMVLAQVFGLISAWLFLQGNGWAVVAGVVIVVVCLAGIFLTLRPATGRELTG